MSAQNKGKKVEPPRHTVTTEVGGNFAHRLQNLGGEDSEVIARNWFRDNLGDLQGEELRSRLVKTAEETADPGEGYPLRGQLTLALSDFIYGISVSHDRQTWEECFVRFAGKAAELFRSAPVSSEDNLIARICRHVDDNLEEDLSLAVLANRFYLNASYLSRVFSARCGYTLSEYVANRRVEKAKELLETSDLSVNEIAMRLGYEIPDSFSRLFKNKTGLSPQRYRAINTGNKEKTFQGIYDSPLVDFGPCTFAPEENNADFFTKR